MSRTTTVQLAALHLLKNREEVGVFALEQVDVLCHVQERPLEMRLCNCFRMSYPEWLVHLLSTIRNVLENFTCDDADNRSRPFQDRMILR